MERTPEPVDGPEPRPRPRPEARQRWRLVYRRRPDAAALDQRATLAAWEDAIRASGLPAVVSDGPTPRPRLAFAAPLSIGLPAERELADLFLTERRQAWQVREGLAAVMPEGHDLVDVYDVWLGAAALPGRVAAADYRILVTAASGVGRIRQAADDLLAATTLPRVRQKGSGVRAYDLRPLLGGIRVRDPGPPIELAVRTMFHVERGSGRPEEVILALADAAGVPIEVVSTTRERLVLADEIEGGDRGRA